MQTVRLLINYQLIETYTNTRKNGGKGYGKED